jgi:hypothetical protein
MIEVREIPVGFTHQAAEAMLVLRPRWKSTATLVDLVDTKLRPSGYRLIGVFPGSSR